MLARCIAHALGNDSTYWATLRSELPNPLRGIDGWLLLRVGANLHPASNIDEADSLAAWFISDPQWPHIIVSSLDGRWNLKLARDFVETVGYKVSNATYHRLETWIAEYHDHWSAEDEKRRPESLPSAHGITAYRLLGALPGTRLSINARSRLKELRRKFDNHVPEPGDSMRGGLITSVIPDNIADNWSADDWKQRLLNLNDPKFCSHPAKWRQLTPDSMGEYTLTQLASQLGRLAKSAPYRYLTHARHFDNSVPPRAREAVLAGIASTRPPDHCTGAEPWEKLGDDEVIEIVARPDYMEEPECDRQIAWIVNERPHAYWPDEVINRLVTLAQGTVSAGTTIPESGDLMMYRTNETGSSALHALGAVAKNQKKRQSQVLAVAIELSEHDNAGRRAASVAAALRCYDSDPVAATALVLSVSAEPGNAAEREMIHALLWFAIKDEKHETQLLAQQRLLALARSDDEHIAHMGGLVVGELRKHSILDDHEFKTLLDANVNVRRGAAENVGSYLANDDIPIMFLELALWLADDPDEKTGDFIAHGFARGTAHNFVRDLDYLHRLLNTNAARRNLHDLIRVCDQQDHLLPMADQIISLSATATSLKLTEFEYWRLWNNRRKAVGILARLAEEAERKADFETRTRAFDAWDSLLEIDDPAAGGAFDTRLKSDTWDASP